MGLSINNKQLITYIKELLRPKRLLAVVRNYQSLEKYSKYRLMLGLYSSLKEVNIENDVFIGDGCSIINSSIGKRTYINTSTNIQNTIIGRFVSIGSDVTIGVGEHPTNFVSTHPTFYSNNKAFHTFSSDNYYQEFQKCEIGNDVWIGSKSTILNGVRIGNGAIVAYGAVVTKDVEPYSIVGGVPAKILKYRFDKDVIDKLESTQWWNLSDEFFQINFRAMHDTEEFFKLFLKTEK